MLQGAQKSTYKVKKHIGKVKAVLNERGRQCQQIVTLMSQVCCSKLVLVICIFKICIPHLVKTTSGALKVCCFLFTFVVYVDFLK